MQTIQSFGKAIILTFVLVGCAAVQHSPVQLQSLAAERLGQQRVLAKAVEVRLATGYQRTLKQGSRWQPVGSLAEGIVYKVLQDVFTLEGAHIHEAYLVIQRDELVGFYLPAERGFSPLQPHLPIHFE